jgi:hypothetical protein
MADHLRIELVFAPEVSIEAAMRQPGSGHDLADGDFGESLAVEQAGSAGDESAAGCLLYALLNTHGPASSPYIAWAKDDLEHLLSPSTLARCNSKIIQR